MESTEGLIPLKPTKRIISNASLAHFLASPAHTFLVDYITALNSSVAGLKLSTPTDAPSSPATTSLLALLDEVEQVVKETPPVENGKSRFGNPAFRTFYDTVVEKSEGWHRSMIPGLGEKWIPEVMGYFVESWGNRTRVDYGSGMELNFICWLYCLRRLGILQKSDDKDTVFKIFWKYMHITRLLQTTYWLEPAGSHGAQGLDDYHFAVFIFGSSQLVDHKHLRPKSIHDPDVLEEFSKDYMYLDYIRYINSIKTASLRWHSPMLDDISGVKTWAKINSGMLKMYLAEVLAKLPVAQHFLFGSLLPFPPTSEDETDAEEDGVHKDEEGHIHVRGMGFEDCCGIKIPGRFAAEAEEKERLRGSGALLGATTASSTRIKRIPFD